LISESLYFTYDNINFYEEFGIMNVHVDSSGMYEENFLASRDIIEQKIRGKSNPYFTEIQESPLELKLTFAFYNGFDQDKIRSVARALKKDYYCPLVFSSLSDHIFYAICVDDSQLVHTGNNDGYITITFRCNSPYSYSPVYVSELYDFSSNDVNGKEIILINNGDEDMYSIITCQVISGGTFSIVNTSNGGEFIGFTEISDLETLTINTENESIQSDLPLTYRLDNMTQFSKFITFKRGINRIKVYGSIKIQFKYENRFLI